MSGRWMTMAKRVLIFGCLGLLGLLYPQVTPAECTDLGGFNRWSLEGVNTVVLFSGATPVGRFDVQNCQVQPSSRIELIKSYVCDGDEVMIDGERCTIMEIKPAS
jgi:hypothetical protein